MDEKNQDDSVVKEEVNNSIKFNVHRELLIDKFNLWMVNNGYSRNTCITYKKQIKILLSETSLKTPSINKKRIDKFLTGKGIVSHSSVRLFLKFIWIEFNKKFYEIDFPRIPKKERRIVEVLSQEEINEIISKINPKYKFLTKFIYICGLRISESYRIKANSLNWKEWKKDKESYGLLKISNTKSKNERLVPVPPKFMEEIHNYMKKREGEVKYNSLLFDFDVKHYFNRKIRKINRKGVGVALNLTEKKFKEYKIDYIWDKYIDKESTSFQTNFRKAAFDILHKESHPHVLRASRATHLLESEVPLLEIRDFLGHSSVSTTERYLSSSIKKLKGSMEKAGI